MINLNLEYFATELETAREYITKDTHDTVAKEHKSAAQVFK